MGLIGECAELTGEETRRQAFQMAVSVCYVDGAPNADEEKFIERLQSLLKISSEDAKFAFLAAKEFSEISVESAVPPPEGEADPEAMILSASIFAAALNLLPEAVAGLGAIPLQLRMVRRIGLIHKYELDLNHIRWIMVACGLGLAAQLIETYAWGLLGESAVKRKSSRRSPPSSDQVAFAATHALGKLASAYYAASRKISAGDLKALFSSNFEKAEKLSSKHESEIKAMARTLKIEKLADMIQHS
ncbi:hypothetical protein HYR69_02820 [Candidatus Sumerlaeota bacterium]|nr:hypothetical protein [Candidatus Sumerlaeota bacterium]